MLLLGRINNLATTERTKILNFNSLNEKYPRLHLMPPMNLGSKNEYDFDMKYAAYILNDPNAFFDLMQIMYPLYEGEDVFLLVDDGPVMEMIVESFQKFIQQRYGYNAVRIYTQDDYIQAQNTRMQFDPTYGLMNLDADKQRYAMMFMNINPVPQFDEDTPPWD